MRIATLGWSIPGGSTHYIATLGWVASTAVIADEVLNLLTSARTLNLTSTATTLNLLSDADTENLE